MVTKEAMPLEYYAMARELAVAYRLLEDQRQLLPGDAVILNAANSTVGQAMLQIARLLRLRVVAVVRPPPETETEGEADIGFEEETVMEARTKTKTKTRTPGGGAGAGEEKYPNGERRETVGVGGKGVNSGGVSMIGRWDQMQAWLRDLGATEVLADRGNLGRELDRRGFLSRPKVAFDSVGGTSAMRIGDVLQDGGKVVVFGCSSGKAPAWPWQHWVFKGLSVEGFNLRQWIKSHAVQNKTMLDSLAQLVTAGKLKLAHTEYDLASEFGEALEHALERGRSTKIILRVGDVGVGVTY